MFFREIEPLDLGWFVEVRNSVRGMLHNPTEFTLEEAMKWLPTTDSKYWIIIMNGQKVGYFRVTQTGKDRVLIGADIDPSHQGQGIATNAYPKFVTDILQPLGFTNLELRVLKKNQIAFKLYSKLGFKVDEETDVDFHMHARADQIRNCGN